MDLSPCDPMSALLTPPDSTEGPPSDHDEEARIHVSTMFYPGAPLGGNDQSSADIVLVSSDSVFFYVHSRTLLQASSNRFSNHIPQGFPHSHTSPEMEPKLISLRESSDLINVLLHVIYNLDCAHYVPPFDTLCATVKCLTTYGYEPKSFLQHKSHLFNIILSYAPSRPLDVYAFAAFHELEDLAVSASSHLLSFPLPTLTDKMCIDIGPVYLKRLFFLHLGRVEALKRLLLSPPHPHPPTESCDFTEQKKMTRAWALAASYLLCDARPDTSVGMLEGALSPLGDHLWCEDCRNVLKERIRTLSVGWSVVKTTI